MSGIGVLQPPSPAIQKGGQAGNVHVGRDILVESVIDVFQYLPWRAQPVGGLQHRAGDRHHEGRRHSLAANISHDQPQPAVRQLQEIVEVAADLARGLVVGRYLVVGKPWQRFRQEGLLDQAGNVQLLFEALPLLGLLLLPGHGALELLGTLYNPIFEVLVELPDLFFYPLELGDVVIHRVCSYPFPTHGHRNGQEFHVHERSIFATTSGDGVDPTVARNLLCVVEDFRMHLRCLGDQVVYAAPDGLGLGISEQPFSRRVPRSNLRIEVHDRDRHRAVEHQRLEILLLSAQFSLRMHQLVVFLFHLSISALQVIVEPRVLHEDEELPQQNQADQHRSPHIDPTRQAAAPTGRAPGIDDEDAYRRHQNVRQQRGPHALFNERECSVGRIARLIRGCLLTRGQSCGEGTQGYKHVSQRPAYIGERTRGVGVVQRPVGEVAVRYHDEDQAKRQKPYGGTESVPPRS